ncbi:MAG: Uma2 family endonuclease [Gemmataceae bacterium]
MLTDSSKRLVEYTDGFLEILAKPTTLHQVISKRLLYRLAACVVPVGGQVFYAPLRLRIRPGKFREPDLLLILDQADQRVMDRYWLGADLLVEIVSEDDPDRDLVQKPIDYAAAGIPEYWIVNPGEETITVLALRRKKYRLHGVFGVREQAKSATIEGLAVDVSEIFADGAGKGASK